MGLSSGREYEKVKHFPACLIPFINNNSFKEQGASRAEERVKGTRESFGSCPCRACVLQAENALKKAEKPLEHQVKHSFRVLTELVIDKNPTSDAQIAHVTRKLNNATKTKKDVTECSRTIATRLDAVREQMASTKRLLVRTLC